MRGGH
jgi:hypothetical protein